MAKHCPFTQSCPRQEFSQAWYVAKYTRPASMIQRAYRGFRDRKILEQLRSSMAQAENETLEQSAEYALLCELQRGMKPAGDLFTVMMRLVRSTHRAQHY